MNTIIENFNSINDLLSALDNRQMNSIYAKSGFESSKTGSKKFTGSEDYEQAEYLIKFGYKDILSKIKDGVGASLKNTNTQNRRRVSTGVVGYAPHVPNAILGLPNSMIYTRNEPQKVKALSIVYCVTENCGTNAQEFIDSGICILNVINKLELSGYRVNLKIMFYCAKENKEYALATVKVKDYKEHLDIQKLCFPIAHPSMLRRFGFKWLETNSEIKETSWPMGYGTSIATRSDTEDILKKNGCLDDNEFYFSLRTTHFYDYDADKLIEVMNSKKKIL